MSSDLFNRMMEANKLTNEQFKAKREADKEEECRARADALARTLINEALQVVKQAKEEHEALAKARAEKQ